MQLCSEPVCRRHRTVIDADQLCHAADRLILFSAGRRTVDEELKSIDAVLSCIHTHQLPQQDLLGIQRQHGGARFRPLAPSIHRPND